MSVTLILLFIATEALFSASPGPAVAMVLSSAVIGGWRGANLSILGVLAGNAVYFTLSAIILMYSVAISEELFTYIRYAGASYLVFIVARDHVVPWLLRRRAPDAVGENAPVAELVPVKRSYFLKTFTLQMANPKTIIFFTAFLPQFITVGGDIPLQFVVLGLLSFAVEYVILAAYAFATIHAAKRFGGGRFKRLFEPIGNATMIGAVVWSFFVHG